MSNCLEGERIVEDLLEVEERKNMVQADRIFTDILGFWRWEPLPLSSIVTVASEMVVSGRGNKEKPLHLG